MIFVGGIFQTFFTRLWWFFEFCVVNGLNRYGIVWKPKKKRLVVLLVYYIPQRNNFAIYYS